MTAPPLPWRRCATCRELLPAEQFPVDYSKRSGRRGICLTCKPPAPPPAPKPAPPPRTVEAMCTSKHRYPNKSRALTVATRAAHRTTLLRVYECPICHGWHLTHKPTYTPRSGNKP